MNLEERKQRAVEHVGELLQEYRARDEDAGESRLDLAIEDREEVQRYADSDVFSELESVSPGHRRAVQSVGELLRRQAFDREDADALDASDDDDDDDAGDVFAE